ncbi:MAG: EAL domain-containing protein [Ilumatobacteraceae bacterium]
MTQVLPAPEKAVDDGAARRRNSRGRIAALSIGLWLLSAALALGLAEHQGWLGAARWPWWIALPGLATAFAVTEIFVVHLRIRADAHTFSLVELPLALGLFFAQPLVLIGAQTLGAGLALALHRRQGVLKLLFNTSVFAVTTTFAISMLRWMAPHLDTLNAAILLEGAEALLVEAFLSVILVYVVISLSAGSWQVADLRSGVAFGVVAALFTSSLGIIAVVVIDAQPGIAWMLVIPTAGTYVANWAYTTQRRRHEGLDFLYRSTQLLHESGELEGAIVQLLRHACETFNAGAAQLVYIAESGEEAVCVRVRVDGEVETVQRLDESHFRLMELMAGRVACIMRPEHEGMIAEFLELAGYQNAIAAPLLGERRVVGALVIANRLSEVVGFDTTDARLAETLANHTTTALENGRLEQSLEQLRVLEGRLTFQATHDSLTGLANRTLFRNDLSHAIEADAGNHGAVLFVDLDDFKTVNDSFGHAIGDALLIEIADRLKGCVSEMDTIARLGGDEFALLLRRADDPEAARMVSQRILAAMDAPAIVAHHRIAVRASIGVAMIEPGANPEAMMRSADTAMYTAKAQGKHRIVLFEPAMYESSLHRFNLQSDLQRAITAKSLGVCYQPIVRVGTHELVGAEALVRWNHPRLGHLAPDAFLPLAEQTGLIVAVDMQVLHAACAWLAAVELTNPGLVPSVHVNLSPRSCYEPNLISNVLSALRRYGLSPGQLGFEITENLMSEQAHRAIGVLHQLKEIGVQLALDDFGTGYSSLSYLQSLPVDAVKIAKPFIDDLESSESERSFTSAIVALGNAMNKFVIAEGVERPEQLEWLEQFGCDAVQGFYFARPLDGEAFVTWARTWSHVDAGRTEAHLSAVRAVRLGAPLMHSFDTR